MHHYVEAQQQDINKIDSFTRKSKRYKKNVVISPLKLFSCENIRIFGDKENPFL
jgi:hypothetical protein